ncbi:MAG TPA: RNA polymerase sigma factor [Ignavibacteria bacterium]|nr:RNA polymerase sigma factor [Ignavibacteria bacterium]HMQ98509.1 RNA polymerase sigma factor [Ignavibacteria bacterium]
MDKDTLFKQVLEENKDRIYRICCAYERNAIDRDDLYQEIIINIWKNLDKFEGRSAISTWVYRIAVNTSLMHVKKESKRNSVTSELDENSLNLAEPPNEDREEKIETGKRIETLYECINELSALDRLIISMVLEDLSYKEIAEVTGLSVNNTGVRINRIKKELFRLMEERTNGN